MDNANQTYCIKRFYAPHTGKENEYREDLTGLTLEEAQEHCDDPSTSCTDWFEGYVKE